MIVQPDDDGQRLDRFLKKHFPAVPFGAMQKLLRTGQVRVDGKRAKGETRLANGQELRLPPMLANPKAAPQETDARDRDFMRGLVLYEDGDIVVINKPAGLAVQGGSGITRHVDGMLDALAGANGVRPRLVHRIDKDTSGLLLLARSAESARRLSATFAGRDVEKVYVAITAPAPAQDKGRIDAAIAKGAAGAVLERMIEDDEAGKAAITDYRVLARAPGSGAAGAALVEFHPLTGRTHQIRVHASIAGFPLWGDRKYGAKAGGRFYLHAARLNLEHPKTGKALTLEAPISADFKTKALALAIPFTISH